MKPFARFLLSFVVAVATLVVAPSGAHAFGNATQIATANKVLDDLSAIDFTSSPQQLIFQVNGQRLVVPITVADAYSAIQRHPDFFRGGAIGPGGFPDPFTGKVLMHGNETPLLRDITRRITNNAVVPVDRATNDPFQVRRGPSEFRAIDFPIAMLAFANGGQYAFGADDERGRVTAFIMGYLAHTVGDAFVTSWANATIGGSWNPTAGNGMFGQFTEEIQTVALQGFVDGKLPRRLTTTSTDLAGPLDRLTARAPINFLDAFYSRLVPNPVLIGDRNGDLGAVIQFFSNTDQFFGGIAYNYFNAQVDLPTALLRWSTLSGFFDFAEDAKNSIWQQTLLAPAELPQWLVDQLERGVPGRAVVDTLLDAFGGCAINFDLTWLTDVWTHIGGINERADEHSEMARVARLNWLRLNECTAVNLARLREGTFDPTRPTENRDACAVIADKPFADQGVDGTGIPGLDRGTVRNGQVGGTAFLNALRAAFYGVSRSDPSRNLEQANEHRLASANLERLLNYLIGVGLTVDSIDEILLSGNDASDTLLNNYHAVCDAVRRPLFDECVAAAVSPILVTVRAADCVNQIRNCTTGFVTACVESACHDICISVVDPIPIIPNSVCGVCNNLGEAPAATCHAAVHGFCCGGFLDLCFPGCQDLLNGAVCNALDVEESECSADALIQCGNEAVQCDRSIFEAAVGLDRPSDAILRRVREFCNAADTALDAVERFKNPATRNQFIFEVAGIDVNQGNAAIVNAEQQRDIYGITFDSLIQEPPETLVNLAFLQRDVLTNPAYGQQLFNLFFQVLGNIQAQPPSPQQQANLAAWNALGQFILPRLPGAPNPPQALTLQDANTIRNAHNLGLIPLLAGPTAANLLGQLGPNFTESFLPFCSSVNGAKVMPLARPDVDALFTQESVPTNLLPWNQGALYSQSCADNPNLMCDVGPSLDDPSCVNCVPPDNVADPARNNWVTARGLTAFNGFDGGGRPLNILTNFALSSSQQAYDTLYRRIFCLPGDGWNMFRGNPARLGQAQAWGPRDAAIVRSVDTGLNVRSSPVLGPDGTIFVGANDNRLRALTPALAPRWTFQASGNIVSTPAVADGSVYVGSNDDRLYRIDAATGAQVWAYDAGGDVSSSPAVTQDGSIYVVSDAPLINLRLHALRPDGTTKWAPVQVEGTSLGEDLLSSPAVGPNGTVYFGTPNNDDFNLYAVSGATGAIAWQAGIGRIGNSDAPDIRATPVATLDGKLYVGTMGQNAALFSVAPATGAPIWAFRVPCDTCEDCSIVSSPAVGEDGRIYFGSRSGDFFGLNSDGRLAWRFSAGSPIVSSPAVGKDGIVYFGTDGGFLYALRTQPGLSATERFVFRVDLQNDVRSSPAISSSGILYVGSDANQLFAIGPSAISLTPSIFDCTGQPDGAACDDGATCTTDDSCFAGICGGADSCPPQAFCAAEVNSCQPFVRPLLATFNENFGALSSNPFRSNSVAKFDIDSFGAPGNRILGENLFFDGTALGPFNAIDAVALLPAGRIVISTTQSGTLAGLSFLRSDLVRWDLNAQTAALHFRPSAVMSCVGFLCTLDLDAVHILPNADILFSTTSRVRVNATGQIFERGSIIRLSPATGAFTEVVDETRLDSRDVDGIGIAPLTGHILVSFNSDGSFAGGPRFEEEDIIELPYGVGQPFVPGYALFFDGSVEMVDPGGNLRDFDLP